MNSKDYIKQSERTAASDYPAIEARMEGGEMIDLLHAGIGLATEGGEFLDALKKSIFYGKELDKVNLAEELGDVLWYVAMALRALGTDFEEQMEININKLKLRYPDKFTEEKAEVRDLTSERELLESSNLKLV